MLQIGFKLDFLQRDTTYTTEKLSTEVSRQECTWEEKVHQLAVGGPGAEMLYLGQAAGEAGVEPGQQLVSAAEYLLNIVTHTLHLDRLLVVTVLKTLTTGPE